MSWRLLFKPATHYCLRVATRTPGCPLHRFGQSLSLHNSPRNQGLPCCQAYSSKSLVRARAVRAPSPCLGVYHLRSAAHGQRQSFGWQACRAVAGIATHTPANAQQAAPQERQLTMDYTALVASVQQITNDWIPAKVEQVSLLSALADRPQL